MKINAIITAGGTSSRFGNTNKLLEKINGEEVIVYTVNAFLKNKKIDKIIICANSSIIKILRQLFRENKDKVSIIKALDILSKNIEVFKNNSEHEKIIKILSGLPLLYLVIKTISFSKI